jgi:hypothetical protein
MHIRDLMWNKLRMWPPEFGLSNQVIGEKGILADVRMRHDLKIKVIIVAATYLGYEGNGIIILEDPLYLDILCDKLKKNIGNHLKKIGDMEIDLGLSVQRKGPKQVRPQTAQDSSSEIFSPLAAKIK